MTPIEWHQANARAMQAEAIRHAFYRLLSPLWRRSRRVAPIRSAASPSG